MRLAGLQGVHGRTGRRRWGQLQKLHQDLVSGEFTVGAPDRVWVADVTQHRTDEGWVYLGVVIDVFHRHVAGSAMDDVLNADLVLSAFKMVH
jgi:putative transposase